MQSTPRAVIIFAIDLDEELQKHQERASPYSEMERALPQRTIGNRKSKKLHDRFFSQFQSALSQSNIPTPEEPSYEATKSALLMLATIDRTASSPSGRQSLAPYLPALEECWPDIVQWLEYFDSHCIKAQAYDENVKISAGNAIPMIITLLGDLGLSRKMVPTSGIYHILIPHWLQETDTVHHDDCPLSSHKEPYDTALRFLFIGNNISSADNTSILNEIVEAAGGDTRKLAVFVIRRLRRALTIESDMAQSVILARLWFIHIFSSDDCLPLRSAMLKHGMMQAVIDTVDIITVKSDPKLPEIQALVTMTYRILCSTLESAACGPLWISEALDAGLLQKMLKGGHMLVVDSNSHGTEARLHSITSSIDSIVVRIFTTLEQYSAYRSVLRSLAKAVVKIEKSRKPITAEVAGPLWGRWKSLLVLAAHRKIALDQFESMRFVGDPSGYQECHRPECSTKHESQGHQFRRCKGCLDAHYCSVKCQSDDWPHHKKNCQPIDSINKEGHRFPLPKLDREFIRFSAARDIQFNAPRVSEIIRKKFQLVPLLDMVVSVNHAEGRPGFDLVKWRNSLFDEELPAMEYLVELAKREGNENNVVLARVIVREGKSFRAEHFSMSLPKNWDKTHMSPLVGEKGQSEATQFNIKAYSEAFVPDPKMQEVWKQEYGIDTRGYEDY